MYIATTVSEYPKLEETYIRRGERGGNLSLCAMSEEGIIGKASQIPQYESTSSTPRCAIVRSTVDHY